MPTNKPQHIIVAALVAFTAFASSLHAEEKASAITPVDMSDLISYIDETSPGKAPLSRKEDSFLETTSTEVVIVHEGLRITLQYFRHAEHRDPSLSLWWRKNGTTGEDTLMTAAVNLDGKVYLGNCKSEDSLFMETPTPIGEPEVRGEKSRDLWQRRVNQIITYSLEYYRKK